MLEKHFPEVVKSSPSIGRQGKALRRRKLSKLLESQIEERHSEPVESNEMADKLASHDCAGMFDQMIIHVAHMRQTPFHICIESVCDMDLCSTYQICHVA